MMNTLDYILLFGAGLFTLLGIYWGLIRQVLSIVGLVVGVAMAGRYGPSVAEWLSSFLSDGLFARVVGFLAVLLLVSAAASLVASLLRIFAGLLFLGWIDHLLGGLLGLLQAVLAGGAILAVLQAYPQPAWSDAIAASTLADDLVFVGRIFSPLLPEIFERIGRGLWGA